MKRTVGKSLIMAFALTAAGHAQLTDGPGIGKVTFKNDQVGKPLYRFQTPKQDWQIRNAWMHNGYFIFTTDIYDMGDPLKPKYMGFTWKYWSAHTYPTMDNYVIEEKFITDATDLSDVKQLGSFTAPVLWRHLQWPYYYAVTTYNGKTHPMSILNFSDPGNPKKVKDINISSLVGFNVGSVHVIGNLMIVSGGDRNNGNATLDLGDPINPKLLDAVKEGHSMYFSQVYGDRVYTTGPTVRGRMSVFDFSDPTNLRMIWSGEPAGMGDYGFFQDGYIFGAAPWEGGGQKWTKIRTADITKDGLGKPMMGTAGGNTRRYAVPVGNMLWIGSHTGGGDAYMHVHQAGPDNEGPEVNYVNPANGATRQPLTSRIGLVFTSQIDNRTIMTGSPNVVVRPVGGDPIEGWLSHQMGIINFSPKSPLRANTTYEIVVKKGGVKDWSGNTAPETFVSRFSTGSTLEKPTALATQQRDAMNQRGPGVIRIRSGALTWTAAGQYDLRGRSMESPPLNPVQNETLRHGTGDARRSVASK